MTTSSTPARALALVALLLAPVVARAQGALSTQGFGYPPGQLSTRALGTGGALAESDEQSPLNPAVVGLSGRSGLYFQYDPEFRTVTLDGASAHTTTSRFPIASATFRLGERGAMGVSASTLLDRSWQTTIDSVRTIDGAQVRTRELFRSLGSISDVRLAGAWSLAKSLRVGAAVHGFTGEHRLTVEGEFGDSATLNLQDDAISYGGVGLSGGLDWRLSKTLALSGSARKGGTIKARRNSAIIGSAHVPDRVGAGVRYEGIPGTTLAARMDWTGWSSLAQLTSGQSKLFDTWDMGAGADVSGPRFMRRIVMLRGGLRYRALPNGLGTTEVKELDLNLGAGLPLAGDRASFDLAAQHAARSAGDVRERAWTISVGLAVRP